MDLVVNILSGAASLVALICFIIVVVKMFQNSQTGLGVASIIGLFCLFGYFIALFVGWKNRTAWKLEKIMPIFTIAFLMAFTLGIYSFVTTFKQGLDAVQTPNSEFDADFDVPEISP